MSVQTACAKRRSRAAHSDGPWISPGEAAAIIGRSTTALKKLAVGGAIRYHQPPGLAARYLRADVMKLAPPSIEDIE